MKVELLHVGDRLSLEMDPPGLAAVKAYIEKTYADLMTRTAGIVTLVRFAGAEFIFENEWDEPYLLAETAEGDDLLKAMCNHFT
jgi:hypothetical protein